jgi:NTE family protein
VSAETASPRASPLARLFEAALARGEAALFALPGGTVLFKTGEPADQIYLLRAGRLGARLEGGGAIARLGIIHPGEAAGEMAVIAGTAHTADVFALRDCEIIALSRNAFLEAARRDPAALVELARLVLARTRPAPHAGGAGGPRVFALAALSGAVRVRSLADEIVEAVGRLGHSAVAAGSEAAGEGAEWFSNLERAHEFVILAAEFDEEGWRARATRQADRVLMAAPGGEGAPARAPFAAPPGAAVDLILLQPQGLAAPSGSQAWIEAAGAERVFHLRRAETGDFARLARTLAGRAVALVLSGGAARAYAQIGVIQVLRESGTPIDFIGGVSMGAVIGAAVAMGWDDAELAAHIRKAFVDSSPLDDIAFPMVALTRGAKVKARLAEHFGDTQISDLWLPFFCAASNLTSGTYQSFRSGLLREALRASLSLPGVLPPVTVGDDVLVDGALMNNFPADVVRGLHTGPIIGVDVGRARSIEAADVAPPASIWRWLVSGDWRRGPPIVSLLMRAATLTGDRDMAAAREAVDLLILPKVDDIEIRDWKAYEPAVAAGRRAALTALARLEAPVTELREETQR